MYILGFSFLSFIPDFFLLTCLTHFSSSLSNFLFKTSNEFLISVTVFSVLERPFFFCRFQFSAKILHPDLSFTKCINHCHLKGPI